MATKTTRTRRIERIKARLEDYYEAEHRLLEGRAKAYAIGSRNLTRYELSLADIRAEIDKLEAELDSLEAEPAARASRAVVITDW